MSSATSLNRNTWMIVFSVFDGTNHTMYINNVAQTPVASTGSFSFDLISIGADDGGGSHLNGEVAEAVVYTQALSSTDRASLFSYLNAKWNIVATTTPVSASRTTTWNVLASGATTPVTATRSTTWNVAAAPSGGVVSTPTFITPVSTTGGTSSINTLATGSFTPAANAVVWAGVAASFDDGGGSTATMVTVSNTGFGTLAVPWSRMVRQQAAVDNATNYSSVNEILDVLRGRTDTLRWNGRRHQDCWQRRPVDVPVGAELAEPH